MRLAAAISLVALGLWLIATAGCASKRASVPAIVEPNPVNGPSHPLPVIR